MNMSKKITCKCCNETDTIENWLKAGFEPNEWNNWQDYILYLQSS